MKYHAESDIKSKFLGLSKRWILLKTVYSRTPFDNAEQKLKIFQKFLKNVLTILIQFVNIVSNSVTEL
jgi:hypothetical protein